MQAMKPSQRHLSNHFSSQRSEDMIKVVPGWWFEPLSKILVNWDDY